MDAFRALSRLWSGHLVIARRCVARHWCGAALLLISPFLAIAVAVAVATPCHLLRVAMWWVMCDAVATEFPMLLYFVL